LRYIRRVSDAASVIRAARRRTGLTQAELARRLGTTQSAVARMERPGSNPTVATLNDALRATGHRLDLRAVRRRATVDEAQLRARLALTPRERLETFLASQASVARLRGAAAADRG
jgi:transcriptional regulator with XRE-family HTH domain